jgi:soluble lytic murein transglycosylase-like protein/tetratricopeptide (TPR) repeat protein
VVGLLAAFLLCSTTAFASLDELARSGDWHRVLEVASRRGEQLPLNPSEALIAATAARSVNDRAAEKRYLEIAIRAADEKVRRLAEVQLADLVSEVAPERAVSLVVPAFERGLSWEVRESATEVARFAIEAGVEAAQRDSLDNAARRLPRSLRRRLELTLALSDVEKERHRLERLLAASTRDLVALEAAEALSGVKDPSSKERWRIAQTLYRHAFFDRAAPMLEELSMVTDGSVPRDDAAFLRGRCAFRRGLWEDALAWYQKAWKLERSSEKRAQIAVHMGRCHELNGDLDKAVESAVWAVRLKTSDDRRLFLARLRLRRGEPDLAEHGISRLRSRNNRARGEVMLAMYDLRRGEENAARRRLEKIRRGFWSVPASVLAAELAGSSGDADAAIQLLQSVPGYEEYWAEQARTVMAGLPEENVETWRRQRERDVRSAGVGLTWDALGRWAVLEPDPDEIRLLRGLVDAVFSSTASPGVPKFPSGLAAELWNIGLESEAARWDPGGWPNHNAAASVWTASSLLANGYPRWSTRVADGAWRQAGSSVPSRVLPEDLRHALYPLPDPGLVREAAAGAAVAWSLLAGVAREESRWDPRALSAVGARGLVQLMPATAEAVAAAAGLPSPTGDDLFDPRLNLQLGATELSQLIEVFDGRWAPAIAAYNAGQAQAQEWLDQCGPDCPPSLYVLNISFATTRAYTAGVLAAADSYEELYGTDERPITERISAVTD